MNVEINSGYFMDLLLRRTSRNFTYHQRYNEQRDETIKYDWRFPRYGVGPEKSE